MPSIPFALGSSKRQAAHLPEFLQKNGYSERAADGGPILIGRPGWTIYSTLGSGPVRGVMSEPGAFGGDLFTVSGGSLYRLATSLGGVSGAARVYMAANTSLLLVTNGSTLYRYNGSSLATVAFPDSAPVVWVGRLGGYFIAIRGADSQRFYWSTDGITWNALDFSSAERKPDPLVGGLVIGDELWLFGEKSVEFFYQTTDADAPFQRIAGRAYSRGCIQRDTICLHDNQATWVGENRVVYKGGAVPERISTFTIDEKLQAASPDDLRAWAFTWSGHDFYCLTIGAEGTFVYDPAAQEWSDWASYGFNYWRAHLGCEFGGRVIAGDALTGNLFELTDDVSLDGEDPIQREFTALMPVDRPTKCSNLIVEAAVGQTRDLTGQGADPQIEMTYSDDDGNLWSDFEAVDLGEQGNYRVQPRWTGLGLVDAPGRVFKWRLSDPSPWRVSRVAVNEDLRGKAR